MNGAAQKPIREHNAELAEFMEAFFPPDPGRSICVFTYDYGRSCWLAKPGLAHLARRGFLNYNEKWECIGPGPQHTQYVRRDLTVSEFNAIPVLDEKSAH